MKALKLISKLFYLLLIFFHPTENISAQNYYSTSVSGPLNPSPTAMSYGKYADTPINPANGTVDVSIPICSLNEGTLNHDVFLSYHTGGIRVSEISSEIGLGWHLNAGGIISRTINGLPDDCADGYYKKAAGLNGSVSEMEDSAEGNIDTEPDVFYYKVGGLSGKFVLDKNKNFRSIPKSDVKINLYRNGNTFQGFMLRSPDGTKYYFGQKPLLGEIQIHSIGDQDSFIESWYLHRIVSFDNKHQIDFEYEDNNYAYPVSPDCHVTAYWNNSLKTCEDCNVVDEVVRVKGKSLKKIITSTKIISFDHIADRVDLFAYLAPTYNTPKPKRIYKINVQNGAHCYFYNLEHSYFSSNGTSYGIYDLDKRLKLDRVKKYSCNGFLIEEPYIIDYFSTEFPSLLDKGIDHWGYYNAKHSNNTKDNLVPPTKVELKNKTLSYGSANRLSEENPMLKGSLKKITYPSKGSTEYTFEANEYSDFQASGNPVNVFTKLTCPFVNGTFNCCDANSTSTSIRTATQYQITSQAHINTGLLELKIKMDPSTNNCAKKKRKTSSIENIKKRCKI